MNVRSLSSPASFAPIGRTIAGHFIVRLLFPLVLSASLGATPATSAGSTATASAAASPSTETAASPHAEALALVLSTQQVAIRQAEGDRAKRWDVDTLERTFHVKRPISPGDVDSTRWFNVTYLIDGREVASWFVDTRTKSVTRHPIQSTR